MSRAPVPRWRLAGLTAALLAGAAVSACDDKAREAGSSPAGAPAGRSALIARGRSVYQTTCIACHNTDPKRPGTLGPDVWGSSRELLAARIEKAAYPPGYAPKRPTQVMQPLPQVLGDLDALHAYLNEGK